MPLTANEVNDNVGPFEVGVSWVLAVGLLLAGGCNGEKPAAQSTTAPTLPAATARASVASARVAPPSSTPQKHASRPAIFLIMARTETGDLVSGTCFYLTRPEGRWLITANHVIRDADPRSIVARVGNASIPLQIAVQDREVDLAALLPSRAIPNTPLVLREDSAHKGETLAITGFPIPDVIGASAPVTVAGQVTDDTTTVGGIAGFALATPTTGGDSGAPVMDAERAVVGVVIYSRNDRKVAYAVDGFHILRLLKEVSP